MRSLKDFNKIFHITEDVPAYDEKAKGGYGVPDEGKKENMKDDSANYGKDGPKKFHPDEREIKDIAEYFTKTSELENENKTTEEDVVKRTEDRANMRDESEEEIIKDERKKEAQKLSVQEIIELVKSLREADIEEIIFAALEHKSASKKNTPTNEVEEKTEETEEKIEEVEEAVEEVGEATEEVEEKAEGVKEKIEQVEKAAEEQEQPTAKTSGDVYEFLKKFLLQKGIEMPISKEIFYSDKPAPQMEEKTVKNKDNNKLIEKKIQLGKKRLMERMKELAGS